MEKSGEDFEYAIAGAGLSGLSLAVSLSRLQKKSAGKQKRVCLIEPRKKYEQDHVWCFWDNVQVSLSKSVPIKKQWHKWKVKFGGKTSVSASAKYPYCCVMAEDYYASAVSELRETDAVTLLLGATLEKVRYDPRKITLDTKNYSLSARLLFDSRPPSFDADDFKQSFFGLHIRTSTDVFDSDCVTLMDFSDAKMSKGFHFYYVLPFSPREALLESVYIGLAQATEDEHKTLLLGYLKSEYGLATFEDIHTERGCLPMQPIALTAPDRRHYMIGTRAGLLRSSTGYAFAAINNFSQQLATALLKEDSPPPPDTLSDKAKLLDRVLLSYFRQCPNDGPFILSSLFEKVEPNIVVRFLADRSSLIDDAAIFAAMPRKFDLSMIMARTRL